MPRPLPQRLGVGAPSPKSNELTRWSRCSTIALAHLGALLCGGCTEPGPAILARPQRIVFDAVEAPPPDVLKATVVARASSGLPVVYTALTPLVCTVDASTGEVIAHAPGLCTVAADQRGDEHYAAAERVLLDLTFTTLAALVFATGPSLVVFDRATVLAVSSGGAAVSYASRTPQLCSVGASSGLVEALAPGTCVVFATAAEDEARLELPIGAAGDPTLPGAPSQIAVWGTSDPSVVGVSVGATDAGGSALVTYEVESRPPGTVASAHTSPFEVRCPDRCAGLAFSVRATNAQGAGPAAPAAHILTAYDVIATFREPDTQPNDTRFVGGFTLDATDGQVLALRGRLSEAMTGSDAVYPNDTMTWLELRHQLVVEPAVIDGTEGSLVATFRNPDRNTLSSEPRYGGTDGWTPGTGRGLHYGYPGENPGNAYVLLFVPSDAPATPLTPSQLEALAYADCAPGGMMGATCMTGTTVARHGAIGTMSGYPIDLSIALHQGSVSPPTD